MLLEMLRRRRRLSSRDHRRRNLELVSNHGRNLNRLLKEIIFRRTKWTVHFTNATTALSARRQTADILKSSRLEGNDG